MIAVSSFRRDFGYVADGQDILPAKWQAAFNNVSSIGQFFGGFICSQVADMIGRKRSIALGIVICTGGIIGQIVTTTRVGFLIAKLVLGLGLGFYLTLGPLCCSEVRFDTAQDRDMNIDQRADYPSCSPWHFNSRCQSWDSSRSAYLQQCHQRVWRPHRPLGIPRALCDPTVLRCISCCRADLRPRIAVVVGAPGSYRGC
jgi:hypothetical protein